MEAFNDLYLKHLACYCLTHITCSSALAARLLERPACTASVADHSSWKLETGQSNHSEAMKPLRSHCPAWYVHAPPPTEACLPSNTHVGMHP